MSLSGERRDVEEPLPEAYASTLREVESHRASPLELEAFLERVSDDADVARGQAASVARGVISVVGDCIGHDELHDAAAQLPPEYGRLFQPAEVPHGETLPETVQRLSDVDSEEEARTACQAVLDALGRRLSQGEDEDLATYLDDEAGRWLTRRVSDAALDLSKAEFVETVEHRADVSEATAREYVRVVTRALAEHVPDEELDHAEAQLPDRYDPLVAFA
ncbi:DUF2267 domain-containing protein [Haloplanus sp. GCM10025708]|uniref:DUF2267 domain-containing protein n=1 Tax=Haloplanus sp. GCM10025708 TaxID=3252679 RepID=UPI0036075CD7